MCKLWKDIRWLCSKWSTLAWCLARLAGQCISMLKAVQHTKLLLWNVYHLRHQRVHWEDILVLDDPTRKDLTWWFEVLEKMGALSQPGQPMYKDRERCISDWMGAHMTTSWRSAFGLGYSLVFSLQCLQPLSDFRLRVYHNVSCFCECQGAHGLHNEGPFLQVGSHELSMQFRFSLTTSVQCHTSCTLGVPFQASQVW